MRSFKKIFLFTLFIGASSHVLPAASRLQGVPSCNFVDIDLGAIYMGAVMRGDVVAINKLIKYGFDANAKIIRTDCKNEVSTLLHVAAEYNQVAIANILLRAGADTSSQTMNNKATPLHIAAFMGNFAMVWFLLLNGANVRVQDCRGRTPYVIAKKKGYESVAKLLRERELRLLARK